MIEKKQISISLKANQNRLKKYNLFNPGPVMISEEVRKQLLLPDICHRESEFSNLLNKISNKLNKIFKADQGFVSLILTGSGTSAMESIISSCIRNKVLCISNGAFGERWSKIISIYNIEKSWLRYGWGVSPKIEDIERVLKKEEEIDSVLMVYAETSTGMLNPVKNIGKLTKKYNKLFLVDAVSALAVDDVNILRDNIDFCASSSHKGICSVPGLSIICVKGSAYDKIRNIKPKNYYCDIKRYFEYLKDKSQTPTTPAVQAFYAMDAALDNLIDEGIDNRIRKIKKYSKKIRDELINLDFELLLDDHFSNGLTSVIIPPKCSYKKIHDYLKKKGFIIYGGKGPLFNNIFQISIMGVINDEIIDNLLNILKQMRKDLNLV